MAFMLKVRWNIRQGERAAFEANQRALCAVMLEHPGVVSTSDLSRRLDQRVDRDLRQRRGLQGAPRQPQGPSPARGGHPGLQVGRLPLLRHPDDASRAILAGFGTTFHPTAEAAFVLNPRADRNSPV